MQIKNIKNIKGIGFGLLLLGLLFILCSVYSMYNVYSGAEAAPSVIQMNSVKLSFPTGPGTLLKPSFCRERNQAR
jgi:hypothetical protein